VFNGLSRSLKCAFEVGATVETVRADKRSRCVVCGRRFDKVQRSEVKNVCAECFCRLGA
jgi:uncharacterized protein with PIN domain